MSKIGMEYPFNRISGKPMKESDTVFRMMSSQPYLYGHDRTRYKYNPTAAQQTAAIMADVDRVQPYRTAWNNHTNSGNKRYKTLRGYSLKSICRSKTRLGSKIGNSML